MFSFLDMMGNYENRKVERFEQEGLIVSTCSVNDADYEFETAVSHKEYNNGDWIIVEGYNTEYDAIVGHKNWVKLMTTEPLPDVLRDNGGSFINLLYDKTLKGDDWRNYLRQKE